MGPYIITGLISVITLWILAKTVKIVPEKEAYIIEQLGKYHKTLDSGFHLVIPFFQKIAYKHSLKEQVLDVEPQICITTDNVQVKVDGILYYKILDPVKASYGIENHRYATAQLSKTTMRSEMGRLELDRTFSERDEVNFAIVKAVDEASDPWGIKVTRYEIKDISPTEAIMVAMEQQMRAEREKRADILSSEGQKLSRINLSKGEREESINISKGEKQRRINESEGRAMAIEITAKATADGIREVAQALSTENGKKAMQLRIADQYIKNLGDLFSEANTSILPLEIAELKSVLSTVVPALTNKSTGKKEG
jgi:regulator of protease activity HflC (stomatin/prohibitin superfamily)